MMTPQRHSRIVSKNWLFYILLCQLFGIVYSIVTASAKGGVNLHGFIYYLMFYLSFTNAITVIASTLFLILEKSIKQRLRSPFLAIPVGILIIVISVSVSNTFVPRVVQSICSPTIPHDVDMSHVLFVSFNVFLSALIIASYAVIFIYGRLRRDWEKKIYEIEGLKRLHAEAKYAALQSKINPHFLFNTLNTILDFIYKSPQKVESAILNLSDIYRRVLGLPDDRPITIAEEMELVTRYLEIEKIRLSERLEYDLTVDETLSGLEIPPLVIQTLVENAVKHGIAPKKEGGRIEVSISRQNGTASILVSDNGMGIREKTHETGFGLTGTKKRLDMVYGGKATFRISRRDSGGTEIRITIPHDH